MSALPITITTAGLQALINAQNTGVSNVVIAALGVCPNQVAITAATTVIPGELKRLGGVAGMVTAEDTIYVSAADQTQDTYTVRTIALYLTDGTLFAGYSQAAPLVEKAGPSQAVLEASIKLTAPLAEVIEFTGGGWVNPPASETVTGVLRLATVDEALAGVNHSRAVTPKGLKAVTAAMMAAIQATLDQVVQALAGKANNGHQHGAGDVITGTFNEARIPDLGQNRITGLIAALAGKAAAVHQHVADDIVSGVLAVARIPALGMEKITGLAVALASKAPLLSPQFTGIAWFGTDSPGKINIQGAADRAGVIEFHGPGGRLAFLGYGDGPSGNPYLGTDGARVWNFQARPAFNGATPWDANNFNPNTKATLGQNGSFADIFASRNAVDGALYFGSNAARWLGYIGGYGFDLHGEGGLFVNGQQTWTTGNFNPAAKADLNGWTNPEGEALVTGLKTFVCPIDNTIAGGTDNYGRAALEVRANTSAGAAYMAFHRPGQFATFLGFDTDNQLKIGGWSMGAQAFRVWSERNLLPASQAETIAGAGSDRFVTPASLWSFARSIGPNGYQQIPGTDLIVQWGVSAASHPEGAVHAALPVAFGGGCLFASAMPRNAAGTITSDYYMQVVGRYLDRIVFFANRANGGAGNVPGYEWMALGLARGNPDPAFDNGGGGLPPGGGGGGGGDQPIEV